MLVADSHLVEWQENPYDFTLAGLILNDGRVEHCFIDTCQCLDTSIRGSRGDRRTSNDMRALEASHRLDLCERDLDLIGRRAADLLDRKLAAGGHIANKINEREAALAEQTDERVRPAVDLGVRAPGVKHAALASSPGQLCKTPRTLSSDDGLHTVAQIVLAKSVA